MELKKINFFAIFDWDNAPNQRYRIEAFLKKQNNILYNYFPIIYNDEVTIFYKTSNYLKKTFLLVKMFFRRLLNLILSLNADRVVIARATFPVGGAFFEWAIKNFLKKKIIYDFDDAIWINSVSDGNRRLAFLKSFSKYADIIKIADVVIAGNSYLASYAKQFNKNVHVIPSCVDLDIYTIEEKKEKLNICIGWSGSETTIPHLLTLKSLLLELQNKYGNKIYFKVISSQQEFSIEGLSIKSVKWSKDNEVKELREFDIGIMPLLDDEWSKGKCSMKGIQYMGIAIPTVMSAVGMNCEVIQNGENGFLANNDLEWLMYLSMLIEDSMLRKQIGGAGRKTVEEKYSVQIWKEKWLQLITT